MTNDVGGVTGNGINVGALSANAIPVSPVTPLSVNADPFVGPGIKNAPPALARAGQFVWLMVLLPLANGNACGVHGLFWLVNR